MTILVAIVRLVLAGVFVVSAIAKLRDRPPQLPGGRGGRRARAAGRPGCGGAPGG